MSSWSNKCSWTSQHLEIVISSFLTTTCFGIMLKHVCLRLVFMHITKPSLIVIEHQYWKSFLISSYVQLLTNDMSVFLPAPLVSSFVWDRYKIQWYSLPQHQYPGAVVSGKVLNHDIQLAQYRYDSGKAVRIILVLQRLHWLVNFTR